MKVLNNISPLPFYEDISMQHHRKSYAFGQIYPLMMAKSWLIPFQFIVELDINSEFNVDFNDDFEYAKGGSSSSSGLSLQKVYLRSLNTASRVDVLSDMTDNGLSITLLSDGLLLIKYLGTQPLFALKEEGPYYLELVFSAGSIYSEVFTVSKDLTKCIRLEYGNTYNLPMPKGHIDFSNDFKFICYLDTIIGKPEYAFEEEATSRMGYTFIESQVSKKIYKFACLAPEYLCDALRVVRLCNFKRIFSGLNFYELTSFSMAPKWEDQGDLASIECEFETGNILQNIGNIK